MRVNGVAPGTGVWIETTLISFLALGGLSLPVRECGLKQSDIEAVIDDYLSLPVRECGLKRQCGYETYTQTGRSRYGSAD